MKWYDDYLDAGGVDRDANPTPGNKKGGLANIVEKAMAPSPSRHRPHRGGALPRGEAPQARPDLRRHPRQRHRLRPLPAGQRHRPAGLHDRPGTPYGLAAAPVIKVCSRNEMKEHWFDLIDVNAGPIATGEKTIADVGTELFHLILDVASGIKQPYSDQYGFHNDLCIFNPAPIT